ncbi:MAG TPA: hypothetical protein VGB85_14640 [Nannocystis sp.]
MSVRAAWMLAIGLGCAPAGSGPIAEPAPAAAPEPATAPELPPELRGVVAPWQRVEPDWLARASVWAVANYVEHRVHQQRGAPGHTAWILLDAFVPTSVPRGDFTAPELLIDRQALQGGEYPPFYAEGRSYLVLLRPGAETARRLADPAGRFTMYERLGPDEVVAIVDLSQSEAEARVAAIAASRSGEREGVRFDPQRWAEARDAPAITPGLHAPVSRFLAAQLKIGMPIDEVRGWLGVPDEQRLVGGTRIDDYLLARAQYRSAHDSATYGVLELRHVDGRLTEGQLRYFRWRVSPGEASSHELSAEQLRALGVASHVLAP